MELHALFPLRGSISPWSDTVLAVLLVMKTVSEYEVNQSPGINLGGKCKGQKFNARKETTSLRDKLGVSYAYLMLEEHIMAKGEKKMSPPPLPPPPQCLVHLAEFNRAQVQKWQRVNVYLPSHYEHCDIQEWNPAHWRLGGGEIYAMECNCNEVMCSYNSKNVL